MGSDSTPRKRCFVLSPIGEEGSPERANADKVLKHLVKKALGPDFEIHRADDSSNPGAITPTIVAGILEADLVVADLSGLNANVFYELAIAHGYNKPTVHMQRAGERPPFDVKDMRVVRYDITDPDDLESAQKKLRDYADFATEKPESVESPLTSAQRFATFQESTDPVVESNVRVLEAVNDLALDVKKALNRSSTRSQTTQAATAQQRAMKTIIERVVAGDRAKESDFESVVTKHTSESFDDWVREQLATVLGVTDAYTLNSTLYDEEVWEEAEE